MTGDSREYIFAAMDKAKYFSVAELVSSATATERGIDNLPSAEVRRNLETLIVKLLDPVREMWGAPLRVNSGYRCAELNRAVGGARGSSHLRGEAADITTSCRNRNKQLFDMIVAAEMEFDQLIDERNYAWLHLSYRAEGNRRQVLHL